MHTKDFSNDSLITLHVYHLPSACLFVPGVKNTTIFSISFGSFDELEPF